MLEYNEERSRRITQFERYLKLMYLRAHKQVGGSCFIVFQEEPTQDDSEDDNLNEDVELPLVVSEQAQGQINIDGLSDDSFLIRESGDDFWRPEDGQSRIVQFSFEEKWFCLDMPCCSLFKPEAEKILRERSGFFYLRDLPQFTLYGEDVEGHDPFRKIYLYGDERSAAEDTAYIFFDVWKFPVDWQFYVTADAFGNGPRFEQNFPLGDIPDPSHERKPGRRYRKRPKHRRVTR